MDYSKYLYTKQKNKKPSPKVQTKEVHLSVRIEKHDINIKINKIKKWLKEGHKVNVSIHFKGREIEHKELGYDILKQFYIEGFNTSHIKDEGHSLWITITNIS